jgi:hypothetical protein
MKATAEERTLSMFTMKTDEEDPYARDGKPPTEAPKLRAKPRPKWFEHREARTFELRMNEKAPVLATIETICDDDDRHDATLRDTYYLARTMKNPDHPMSFTSMVDATTCVLEMLKE